MVNKISLLSVSAALVSLVHFPVIAETVTVQSSSQDANVSGSNNQVIQTTNQVIINHPGQGSLNRDKDKPNRSNAEFSSSDDNNNRGNHYGQRKHEGRNDH